jgi:O-antigen/teichoic acid export membrane protein
MGIVFKQSLSNTIILFLGFAIGGINVLFLYTHFLHEDYFGLVTFLLSTANILLPLVVFGMQHTIIKYFSSYATKIERDGFLTLSLLLPMAVLIPFGLVGVWFYENISIWISTENILIKNYTYLILLLAVFMGYFEVFYSWAKVQLKSVFGSFIKEIFARICISGLLVAVYFGWVSNEQFIHAVVIVYALRMIVMMLAAIYLYRPKLTLKVPANFKEIITYSIYIIAAGSAAGILLEIDKFMIPQLEAIAEVAYYAVGVYIASVIGIPTRAMQQITTPITAKEMNSQKMKEVGALYKQSSINLLVVGGLLFLLINLNISDLYGLINKPEFSKGIWIVLIISAVKLLELAMGIGNAILTNSIYYRILFYLSIAMALSVIVLNRWLIELIGIIGAAWATLIVVVVYSSIKVFYINSKLRIQPFSWATFKLSMTIVVLYFSFYFWNFSFHPLINILLNCGLISLIYIFLMQRLKISEEISELIRLIFKSLKIK